MSHDFASIPSKEFHIREVRASLTEEAYGDLKNIPITKALIRGNPLAREESGKLAEFIKQPSN